MLAVTSLTINNFQLPIFAALKLYSAFVILVVTTLTIGSYQLPIICII
jgi:hypothetical protein